MTAPAPDVVREGGAVLEAYQGMLESVHGRCPSAARVMCMAFREWTDGLCDSGSGVPISDLETRLSRVIESLSGVAE